MFLTKQALQGFSGVLIVVGHFLDSFPIGSELHTVEIELYGTLFGQARWKFQLDLSNKARESNSHCKKFISSKKEFKVSHSYQNSWKALRYPLHTHPSNGWISLILFYLLFH